jgi:Cu/Ag efflux protein CusF
MTKIAAIAVALVLGLSMAAWAGDVTGKVQSVDSSERVIVLEDGTKLWIAEGLPLDDLKEGAKVKASYEERDGKNVVTKIEVE